MWLLSVGLIVIIISLPDATLSKCVLYGFCHQSTDDLKQQCLYDGPPKLLSNETGLKLLEKWCPFLLNKSGDTNTCCNTEQLLAMQSQMNYMEGVFRRCPSCMQNLITMTCHSTCSTDMSDYLQVTDVAINEKTLERYATGITMYFSSHFKDGAYKACSHVLLPSMGKLVTDATCGIYPSSQCNPERWFHFFGDPSLNPQAPMKVNFKRQDTPFLSYTPFNATIYKCNESPNNSSAPCSCIDCEDSCPTSTHYISEELDFFILGLNGIIFIVVCVYILLLIILLILRWKQNRSQRVINKEPSIYLEEDDDFSLDEDYIHLTFLSKFSDNVEEKLEYIFFICGKDVAKHPTLVLAICSWLTAICVFGLTYLDITTDPVKIWASPTSRSRLEKDYFEDKFQPFYRTEQIFFKPINLEKIQHETSTGTIEFGPAFHKEFLLTVFQLQQKIEAIPGLKDVCFAPLSTNGVKAKTVSECTVESVFGYFGNDINKFNETSLNDKNITVNYLDHLYRCLQSSVSVECLAPYGGNVEPALAVGGFLKYGNEAYEKADALVVTYILNNHVDDKDLEPVMEWEKKFIEVIQTWTENEKPDFMDISFRAEVSIEIEISKESNAEIVTVVISYICMFIYVSLALGSYTSCRTLFIDSKIMLGLAGIIVVLISVLSSIGIFGYIGTPTTLLTMEVIPFLLLAVGVDNMFLMVSTCSRVSRSTKDPALCIAESMSHIGPSLLLTTLSEAACFAIGAISDMPAVKTFALYAMLAIIINFFLQMTAFVALLALDLKRTKDRRFDIFCCFSNNRQEKSNYHSWIESFLNDYIIPVIFNRFVSFIFFFSFITYFFLSLALIQYIDPGLDQKLSMPEDSYVTKYFEDMDEVLSIGPNVYFVLKPGLDFTKEEDQNLICGGLRCNDDSLSTQIHIAAKQKEKTYLRTAASSWLDDFNDWATVDGCCKMYSNGTFCPHSDSKDCVACNIQTNSDGTRALASSFKKFLPYFLRDNPDTSCPKAGHAAYGQGVNYEIDLSGQSVVLDSYFMAYHTTLKTSKDYYSALQMARKVAADITSMFQKYHKNDIEVFPYSIFYVFYEQYLTIWYSMITSLFYSFAAVFVVTFIFTSFDFLSSLIVLLTVVMIVIDLAALMYLWNITLNAITLVNLVVVIPYFSSQQSLLMLLSYLWWMPSSLAVGRGLFTVIMAVGISVEFCSHIVHSFGLSDKKTKKLRAQDALVNTGSSVFSGITLTKFIGIIVLAFSRTQIFRVFYFRMYFGMVIFGAAHGLIFLPILLSYIGPDNRQRMLAKKRRTAD